MILLYPCTDCPNGLTEHRNSSCVRCKAKFEARFNPDDRPAITPRPGRWARFLQRLGGRA